jgi:hypothetical protein
MVIDTGGNVGINNTSPSATLTVGPASTGQSGGDNSVIARFSASNSTGKVYGLTVGNTGTAAVNNESIISFVNAPDWSATGAISTITTNASSALSDMRFYVYSGSALAQRMTLTGAGNLSVVGTISASNFSGTSSGTNTGDQTLAGLGGVAKAGDTMTGDLTMSGSSRGIYFTGGNNRIYFTGYRAIEGSTDGGNLQIGEGYTQTQLQSVTLKADGGISDADFTRVVNPRGGTYITGASSVTGAIKIRIGAAYRTATMMRITVKIYQYNTGECATIECGGYNYSADSNWYNPFAYQNSDGFRDINVRFGIEGGYDCIWIGETTDGWAYPQVFVTEWQGGYGGYSATYTKDWVVSYVTTLGSVSQTRKAYKLITQAGGAIAGSLTTTGGLAANVGGNASAYGNGLSLWDAVTGTTSNIMFKYGSSIFGGHGGIATAEYATYFVMDTSNRGWIFRHATSTTAGTNTASIRNSDGVMTLGTSFSISSVHAQLNVSNGQGSATTYRDIDIKGSWAAGEGHAITATHGTSSSNIVGQIVFQHDSPGSRIKFGRLYHSADRSEYPIEFISNGFTGGAYIRIDTAVLDTNTRDAIYLFEDDGQATGRQAISWYNGNQSYYKARLWTEVGSSYAATQFGIDVANDARTVATRLYIRNGDTYHSGDVIAYASDYRLKENIRSIENPIEKILKIRGVSYRWKDEVEDLGFSPTKKDDIGVIAQEILEVIPEAVRPAPFDYINGSSVSGENYLTVQYEKIVPLLIESIKELNQKVEDQQSLINFLINKQS